MRKCIRATNNAAFECAAYLIVGRFGANIDLDGVMGGAALAYRFFGDERASGDIFAGFRIWSLEASIDFENLPSISLSTTLAGTVRRN